MCVSYTFGQQHGQVHVETYLHTKHVAFYVLLKTTRLSRKESLVYITIHTLLYMQYVRASMTVSLCLHCCTCSMYDCHVMWLSFNVKRATQHASLAVFYYHKSVWNL